MKERLSSEHISESLRLERTFLCLWCKLRLNLFELFVLFDDELDQINKANNFDVLG